MPHLVFLLWLVFQAVADAQYIKINNSHTAVFVSF